MPVMVRIEPRRVRHKIDLHLIFFILFLALDSQNR